MRTYAQRHLPTLSREIADIRTELSMLRERLHAEAAHLDEARLRVLIAETPVADRDLHRAAHAVHRVRERIQALETVLETLLAEERRLSEEPGST